MLKIPKECFLGYVNTILILLALKINQPKSLTLLKMINRNSRRVVRET